MASRTRVTIDGTEAVFHIKPFLARQAARKLAELQRLIAAPLAKLDGGGAFDGKTGDEMTSTMVKAIGEISMGFDEKTVDKLCLMLLDPDYISVELDGEPAARLDDTKFDLAVTDVAVLFELMLEVIKINFALAFTRGFGRIGRALSSKGTNPLARFLPSSSTS